MSNTVALLDKARNLCVPQTDYRLAKTLGIDSTTIARCRHRGGTLDNKAAHALAAFLNRDFEEVLALIELDRAKTPKQKSYWEKVAPRVIPAIFILACFRNDPMPEATQHLTDSSQKSISYRWSIIL